MNSNKSRILIVIMLVTILILYMKYQRAQTKLFLQSLDLKYLYERAMWHTEAVEEFYSPDITTETEPDPPYMQRSYKLQQTGNYQLPDLEDNEAELYFESHTNIFFIISTIFQSGLAKLNPRQTCAIESAARSNPEWKVFVLFVSATEFSFFNSPNIVPLLPYPNVFLRRVNMTTFGLGSPVEEMFERGALNNSSFIVEHTSDVLRLLTVYKYGGTYLDTDVVVMKSLDELPLNYLVSEGDGFVANGIINLQASGVGHTLAESMLRDVAKNYSATEWAANGPFLVTRILRQYCNVTEPWHMTREQCGGQFGVLPPDQFFQVFYPHQSWYFEANRTREVMERMKGKVLTHLWNKLTNGIKLKKDANAAYIELARLYCPNALWSVKEYF
uniref:Lactosylceramide 4-alpha-galactosyltransferase n=1 Tax=Culex pipiens TaxID=7175 RepID=A0A8D8GDZ4_CULPI